MDWVNSLIIMAFSLLIVILFLILIPIFIRFQVRKKRSNNGKNLIDHLRVNQNSFQSFAKFYGEVVPSDQAFDYKLDTIYRLVTVENMSDIKKIAEKSSCTIPECVLKIKYLKNKRLIGDYYLDTIHLQLFPCSPEDEILLDKYKPYIYGSHIQVDEMLNLVPNPNFLRKKELRSLILEELRYLDKKGLLNGLKIDDIDGKIIYYTIEKRKVYEDHETVHCPNCGALNDVDIHEKVRCSYCQTILVGKSFRENVEE